MGNSNNHHSDEKKPVAFLAPLIFGLVVIFIILSFVSLGNPSHGHAECECKENCSEECMKACKEGRHDEYMAEHAAKDHQTEANVTETVAPEAPAHEMVALFLSNGKEVKANKGGVEEQLINFLNDAKTPVSSTTWFDFDNLLFESGKATLTPESNQQLSNVAEILAAYPKAKIKIGGYTDNSGDSLANVKLSQERAESVLAELKKLKVNAKQLEKAEGYGPMHPIADNATEEGKAKNRRISINVKEK